MTIATTLSRSDAARWALTRRQARRGMLEFAKYVHPRYIADPMHALIASKLDDVIAGKSRRLIITAPPQTGKSKLVSETFPAFWLGQRPHDPIVMTSYTAPLIEDKSRQARDLVQGDLFATLFGRMATETVAPVEANMGSRAVDEWRLAPPYSGGVRATGIGGGLTGYPATLGIIDDPFKGPDDAYSFAARQRVWEFYAQVLLTRIAENGAIVIIMTRWHEDDLVGRLLQAEPGVWEILRLAAIAETQEERDYNNKKLGLPPGLPDPLGRAPGAVVAPNRFSYKTLMARKITAGNSWHALYQGVPRSPEGSLIKREWISGDGRIVNDVPADARRVRYWDKAGTQGGGAYTAGVKLAFHGTLVYVEHVVRGQWSAGQREQIIKEVAQWDAEQHGGEWVVQTFVEQEPGSGGKESAENTIANLAGFNIKADAPKGNKDLRIEPFAAQAEAGNVRIKYDPRWNYEYIEELASLPNGAYRDQSDATAGAYNKGARPTRAGAVIDQW